MKVFFGDSFTEGSGSENGSSFVDYIEGDKIYNCGVSGTAMGEYSIYPVDGNSLISKYDILLTKKADEIFLEYGINDVSSIMCGFVKEQQVLVSFIKALDGIRQLNPDAKIYFLTISNNFDIIKEYAKLQCNYLSNDYFKEFNFRFPPNIWADYYRLIITNIEKKIPLIPMITDISFLDKYISSDKIHPNLEGYSIIAKNIEKYL